MFFSSTFHLESLLHGKINTQEDATYNFQSILHDDAKTWADAGPFKVKYPVNAENFLLYFKEAPFNNLKKFKSASNP